MYVIVICKIQICTYEDLSIHLYSWNCSALTSDLTAIKNCFSSPGSSSCTSVWGGASSLPSVLAGKCEQSSCDDLAPIKSCMSDYSASACTGQLD